MLQGAFDQPLSQRGQIEHISQAKAKMALDHLQMVSAGLSPDAVVGQSLRRHPQLLSEVADNGRRGGHEIVRTEPHQA